jgi:molybdate transport system substrate-binding protein
MVALAVLVVAAGCSGDRSRRSGAGLTVLAAASLTEAFTDLRSAVTPGLSLTYSFAGSGALAAEIRQGAPADVVAMADRSTMQALVDDGLVETPMTFARNELEILVAPGNPRRINALADLARTDLKVVLADDSVPAGRYAAQALQSSGTAVRPVSKETDVKAAVAKVTLGEADATIVYVTDVRAAGGKGQGVEIPPAQNVVADYPIALVTGRKHRAAGAAFVAAVLGAPGQDALRNRGFLPAARPS